MRESGDTLAGITDISVASDVDGVLQAVTLCPWLKALPTSLHSDSEMEMEAEHYPNGILESVSTRIVNGAYKHEDLQTDESSMGKGEGWHGLSSGVLISLMPATCSGAGDGYTVAA